MSGYSDTWAEFRQVIESTRKKLLKRPNYPQAINQLNSISLKMQDEEVPQHAAVCHLELAQIHKKMSEPNEERRQYLIAANLLMDAYRKHQTSGSRVHCYYPSEICDCYTKAVKISMDFKALRLAGITSLEAAKIMKECQNYEMAIEHAHRAIRLLDGEFFTHSQALYCLAEIHFSMSHWEQLLATVDDLWITVMKNRAKTFLGRKILKDCEIITMLSLQQIHMTPTGRHKVLMELYGQQLKVSLDKSPSRACSRDDSSLSKEEFTAFKRFLELLQAGKVYDAEKMLYSSETVDGVSDNMQNEKPLNCDFLSDFAKRICSRIMGFNTEDYFNAAT